MENSITILILIAGVAFLYSSVGHGGASGYLALMALFSFQPSEIRPSALLLNILVSAVSFFQFYRSGNFKWTLFYPFIILSIPFAFIGSMIKIDPGIYQIILGICIGFAALRIIGFFGKSIIGEKRTIQFFPALVSGGGIGFISGLIGIGGGILLSPLLIFFKWADLKEAASVSALFILVNSISGLTGLISAGAIFSPDIIFWVGAALSGGLIGSYFGSRIMNYSVLRYLLSTVLLFASIKLIVN